MEREIELWRGHDTTPFRIIKGTFNNPRTMWECVFSQPDGEDLFKDESLQVIPKPPFGQMEIRYPVWGIVWL